MSSSGKRARYGLSKITSQIRASRKKRASVRPMSRTIVSVPRNLTGFPPILKNTLKYASTQTFSMGAGFGSYLFSTNGLFDPDQTGAGTHQPLYFDQLTAIYDHYRVVKSKCTFKFKNSNNVNYSIVMFIDDDTTIATGVVGIYPAAERQGAKLVVYNGSVAPAPKTTLYWDSNKAFGTRSMADTDLQGTIGTNPVEQQHFAIYGYDDTRSASVFTFDVEIEYTTLWDELTSMTAS